MSFLERTFIPTVSERDSFDVHHTHSACMSISLAIHSFTRIFIIETVQSPSLVSSILRDVEKERGLTSQKRHWTTSHDKKPTSLAMNCSIEWSKRGFRSQESKCRNERDEVSVCKTPSKSYRSLHIISSYLQGDSFSRRQWSKNNQKCIERTTEQENKVCIHTQHQIMMTMMMTMMWEKI